MKGVHGSLDIARCGNRPADREAICIRGRNGRAAPSAGKRGLHRGGNMRCGKGIFNEYAQG